MRVGLTSYDTKLFVNYSVIINYYLLISFFEKKWVTSCIHWILRFWKYCTYPMDNDFSARKHLPLDKSLDITIHPLNRPGPYNRNKVTLIITVCFTLAQKLGNYKYVFVGKGLCWVSATVPLSFSNSTVNLLSIASSVKKEPLLQTIPVFYVNSSLKCLLSQLG